ncbi:MAG TPA: mechanosensitive ion channel domain-containing protein [Nitrososphaerales archaeon]|nr:mechanosensitive ion channel domain-containing protein [Nitrososphaerales archaeon]
MSLQLLQVNPYSDPAAFFLASLESAFIALIAAIITLLIAYLILKILVTIVKHDLRRRQVPGALVGMFSTALAAIFWYFVVMAILSTLPGFSQMVLGMGIIFAFFVLAVGLAVSGVLKELVSGAFLVTDKDYGAGFRVRAGGIEGTVESVDIRKSRIRDEHGVLHIVPNSLIEPAEWTVYGRSGNESKSQESRTLPS